MKYYTLLFCLFFSLSIQAQQEWSWGIQNQIGISGKNETGYGNVSGITSSGYNEPYKRTYAAIATGIWAKRMLSKRIGIRSGLQYLYTQHKQGMRQIRRNNTNSSISLHTDEYTSFNVHRIQIPIVVEMDINITKIRPTIGLGLVWNRDHVRNLRHYEKDLLTHTESVDVPTGFSTHFTEQNIQWRWSIGANITPAISLAIIFDKAYNFGTVEWIRSSFPTATNSYYSVVRTNHNDMKSIAIQYKF